jgi:ribonuclease VapC
MAIVLREPQAGLCVTALTSRPELIISAATLAEALIVAGRRGLGEQMSELIEKVGLTVIDVTKAAAVGAAESHRRWGKGRHPAGLNYGDCFTYELAARMNCPLLYVGNDFSKTDLASAL